MTRMLVSGGSSRQVLHLTGESRSQPLVQLRQSGGRDCRGDTDQFKANSPRLSLQRASQRTWLVSDRSATCWLTLAGDPTEGAE